MSKGVKASRCHGNARSHSGAEGGGRSAISTWSRGAVSHCRGSVKNESPELLVVHYRESLNLPRCNSVQTLTFKAELGVVKSYWKWNRFRDT